MTDTKDFVHTGESGIKNWFCLSTTTDVKIIKL
jgi:hypothetical protein